MAMTTSFITPAQTAPALSRLGVCKGGMVWQAETMVDDRTRHRLSASLSDRRRVSRIVDPDGKDLPACE